MLVWPFASWSLTRWWYHLWMYDGLPGATGLLGKALGAQGEGAYDAMIVEMFVICAASLAIGAVGVRQIFRYLAAARATRSDVQ